MMDILWIRAGWYMYRTREGHPISVWRAMFSSYPRFGPYEVDEKGCPEWIKDYAKSCEILQE